MMLCWIARLVPALHEAAVLKSARWVTFATLFEIESAIERKPESK